MGPSKAIDIHEKDMKAIMLQIKSCSFTCNFSLRLNCMPYYGLQFDTTSKNGFVVLSFHGQSGHLPIASFAFCFFNLTKSYFIPSKNKAVILIPRKLRNYRDFGQYLNFAYMDIIWHKLMDCRSYILHTNSRSGLAFLMFLLYKVS